MSAPQLRLLSPPAPTISAQRIWYPVDRFASAELFLRECVRVPVSITSRATDLIETLASERSASARECFDIVTICGHQTYEKSYSQACTMAQARESTPLANGSIVPFLFRNFCNLFDAQNKKDKKEGQKDDPFEIVFVHLLEIAVDEQDMLLLEGNGEGGLSIKTLAMRNLARHLTPRTVQWIFAGSPVVVPVEMWGRKKQ